MTDPRIADGGPLAAHVTRSTQPLLFDWLERTQPSAHSDVGSALLDAARATLGDGFTAWSPSWAQCRYVIVCAHGRALALAHGMQTVAVGVADVQRAVAMAHGAAARDDLGSGWAGFELWQPGAKPVDLAFWLRAADAHARAALPKA